MKEVWAVSEYHKSSIGPMTNVSCKNEKVEVECGRSRSSCDESKSKAHLSTEGISNFAHLKSVKC